MAAQFETFDDDLEELRLRCGSDDAGIRRVAMLELGEAFDPGAIDLLVTGLNDEDAGVREAAAKSPTNMTGQKSFAAWSRLWKMPCRQCGRQRPTHWPKRKNVAATTC